MSPFYRWRHDRGMVSFFPKFTWLVSGRAWLELLSSRESALDYFLHCQGWGFKMGCVPPLCPEEPIRGYQLELLRVTQTEQKVQVRAGVVAKQSLETCPVLPAPVHKSSGRCPPPQSHCCQLTRSLHPHWCYAIGRTKERHRGGKEWCYRERREAQGILLAALNRLIVPSSPQLRDGPTRELIDTRNNLEVNSSLRVSLSLEVQPWGQQLNKQNDH